MVRIKYRYLVGFVSVQSTIRLSSSRPPGYPGCCLDDKAAMRIGEADLIGIMKQALLEAHGSLGIGKCMSRFRIIHWCAASGLIIIRCLRDYSDLIQVGLALIGRIEIDKQKRNCLIDIHHSSGTVRGCQKFLIEFYSRQLFSKPNPTFQSALATAVNQNFISATPPSISND